MNINNKLWSRVETTAVVRGKPITSWYSFRTPISTDEVRRMDAALVRAFGNDGSRTVATPYEG